MKKKILVVLASLIAVIVIGMGAYYAVTAKWAPKKTDLTNSIKEEQKKVETKPVPVDQEFLFLLVGVDDDLGNSANATRTDTIMLIKANLSKGEVSIVSIPRDSRVLVNGKLDKINHAHAYGGMDLTMQTIRDYMGIDLQHYVKLNFESVKDVVDIMGGVEIELNDQMASVVGLSPGVHLLNGKQAMEFVRFRKGYENGDIGRVAAQQYFMREMIKQILTTDNLIKLPSIAANLQNYVVTNMDFENILGAFPAVQNMKNAGLTTYIIPGRPEMIDGLSYYIVEETGKDDIVNNVLKNFRRSQ